MVELGVEAVDEGLEAVDLLLEFEDPSDAGDVDASGGESGDFSQSGHVVAAVDAGAAGAAVRFDEAFALVDPKGLGVKSA